MRYDNEHKAETRTRIVQSAARQVRRNGPQKVGVVGVMASVGLTHGGFYAHFASKDALIAEAIDVMFADARRRSGLDAALADEPGNGESVHVAPGNVAPCGVEPGNVRAVFRRYLAAYLSSEHRDNPDRGCPLPALSADIARCAGSAQARFAAGLADLTGRIEAVVCRIGIANPSSEAAAIVAQMAGAIGLARAVGNGPQSDAILRDTYGALCCRLGL